MDFAEQTKADDTLILAGLSNDPDACGKALAAGANIDVEVSNGTALILHLIESQDYLAAEFLISRGAEVNVRDGSGVTPLHLAASHGRSGLARLLMSRGADRHVPDKRNQTPTEQARPGITFGWDHLSAEALRCLKSNNLPEDISLLLSEGQPTQALLELCGSHRIVELFHPDRWRNRLRDGLEFYEQISVAFPAYWQHRQLIDLSPLRRSVVADTNQRRVPFQRFKRVPSTKEE